MVVLGAATGLPSNTREARGVPSCFARFPDGSCTLGAVRALPLLLAIAIPLARADEAPGPDLKAIEPAELREEVRGIVDDPSVGTQVTRRVRCDPETYRSLLSDLPLAAKALRALDMGDYAIEAVEGGITIDDKAGAKARCVFGYDQPSRVLVVARGTVEQAPIPQVHGTGVIHVTWTKLEKEPGTILARCRVDFRLESRLLHLLTGPFRKALSAVLGEKLARLVNAAAPLAEAITEDPWKVLHALEEKGEASPEELERFKLRYLAH